MKSLCHKNVWKLIPINSEFSPLRMYFAVNKFVEWNSIKRWHECQISHSHHPTSMHATRKNFHRTSPTRDVLLCTLVCLNGFQFIPIYIIQSQLTAQLVSIWRERRKLKIISHVYCSNSWKCFSFATSSMKANNNKSNLFWAFQLKAREKNVDLIRVERSKQQIAEN